MIKIVMLRIGFFILSFFPIFAMGQPNADFKVQNKKVGCSPLSINFQDQSSGNISQYFWRLGNGNTSTSQNPSAVYIQPGQYSVTLIVTNNSGQKDSITKTNYIKVYENPTADFSVSPKEGCQPLSVNFTNQSQKGSGTITSYTWDFGDGTVVSQKNPSYTYTDSGEFDVSLLVEDANGCSDDIIKDDLINSTKKPTVNFTASDSIACETPYKVDFTELAKSFAKGGLDYKWEFGDGSTSTQPNPSHTYTSKGKFDVTLTVTDQTGCTNSLTKQAFVITEKEQASFNVNSQKGCDPFTVQFNNTSSPNVPKSQYTWRFGDGAKSNKKNPTHTYTQPGTYSVTLIVQSSQECVDSVIKQDFITVDPKPSIDFSANNKLICKAPFKVEFSTSGETSSIKTWNWDFGDGTGASVKNPEHTYGSEGYFDVTLKVTDDNGCKNGIKKNKFITVKTPNASFSISKEEGCKPLNVDFTNQSSSEDPIVDNKWYFGDGNTSNATNPSYKYLDTGKFKPKLIVTTHKGCKDSTSFEFIRVGRKPEPDFVADKKEGCLEDLKVNFTNLTNNNDPKADSFKWKFGDGGTSTDENPTHQYDHKPDSLDVTLIAKNNGCSDTLIKREYIKIKPPWANFSNRTNECKKDSVIFTDQSEGADSVKWKFGDGATSFKRNPSHVYGGPGNYEVSLIVWNKGNGCVDTMKKQIFVKPPFKASFSQSTDGGCYPLKVKFQGTVSDSASFYWNFGNGETSNKINPTVEYKEPGNYDVTFEATSGGCTREITKSASVKVHGTKLDLSVTPDAGCTPLNTQIICKVNPSSSLTAQSLNTGDSVFNPIPDTLNYTYKTPPHDQTEGYQVTLNTVDSAGCKNTEKRTVKPAKPRPVITQTKTPYCDSITYHFKPALTDSNGILPMDYQWNFSSGEQYTTKNVNKTFVRDQDIDITLQLEDSLGCKSSIKKDFKFNSRELEASFTADTTYGDCPTLSVNFKDKSQKGYVPIEKWNWEFGDNSGSSKRNPQKLYLVPGEYTVKLTVTDTIGCVDSFVGANYIILDGPTGTYNFQPKSGCQPLKVEFNSTTQNASKVQWDMGDGSLLTAEDTSYFYTRPTTYIPRLVLSDTTGCTYAVPPKDTIKVRRDPEANFSFKGRCFDYPTVFKDSSEANADTLKEWIWKFGDGNSASGANATNIYKKPGLFDVTHIVQNSRNCYDTVTKTIDIGGLDAQFVANDTIGCQGTIINFFDQTFADTTISSYKWNFGDSTTSSQINPSKIYPKSGIYDVKLTVNDVEGCRDTLLRPRYIEVGDTLPPQAPPIYRATVESNTKVKLTFGKYNDFDLERYIIYRKVQGGGFKAIDSINSVADTIYIDKNLNTLENSYCYKIQVESYCHRYSDLDNIREHCTIELEATPDTNRTFLSWNHYKGWDKIQRYEIFRKRLNQPGKYFKIGEVPQDSSFYIDSGIECYERHFYKIKAIEEGGNQQVSWSDTSGAKPVYIPNVSENKVVRATVVNNRYNLVEWTNPPDEDVYQYLVYKAGEDGSYEQVDKIFGGRDLSYKDHNVNVQETNYSYRVQVMDSCYDLSNHSNRGRTILLDVKMNEEFRPQLEWTRYKKWDKGVRKYEIEIEQSNGTFRKIGATPNGLDTSFTDNVTNLNSMDEYRYRVKAYKRDTSIISISNEAVAEGRSRIHVPNVFSPNGDGINDKFSPKGLYIKDFEMQIYDRWGKLIYESKDIDEGWDGTEEGKKYPADAYIYVIKAVGINGKPYNLGGDVTLVR